MARPIEGADLVLLEGSPDGEPNAFAKDKEATWARSDSSGRASIPISGALLGQISVHAPGYRPQRRSVVGGGSLVVHLERVFPGGRELRIVDAATGAPLGGSRLLSGPHTIHHDGAGTGLLVLPEDLADHELLRIEVAGYSGFEAEAGNLRSHAELALYPQGRLEVEVLDPDGLPAPRTLAWILPAKLQGEQPPVLTPEQGGDGQGGFAFDIPLGVPLEITALGPEGTGVRHEQTFVAPRTRLTLFLEPGPTLTLDILDGQGRGILASARVEYDAGQGRTLELRGSRLSIPRPALVRGIAIRAPGKALEYLTPIATEVRREGELRLRLRDAVEVGVRVVDSSDRGIAGLAVYGFPVRDPWAIHRHPGLQGGLPSEHPGWSRRDAPASIAWTDAQGRALLRDVPAGVLRLSPMLPEPFAPILHLIRGPALLEARVPCEREHVLVLHDAELWEVRAKDASDGRALHGFEVRLEGESALPGQDRERSAAWTGWIPRGTGRVWVGAPGYVRSELRLNPDAAGERILEVALEPGFEGRVRLTGDLEVVRDRELRFRVFAPRAGYLSQIDAGTLFVGDGGEASLSLPAGVGLQLELEPFERDGVAYGFEPARRPLDWGAPSFRIVPR